jgi:DNA-binding beta-propeller fold protein YncE
MGGEYAYTLRRVLARAVLILAGLCIVFGSTSPPASAGGSHIFSFAFGTEGQGAGKFETPEGIAVNDSSEPLVDPAAGDVYVVDQGNNRIDKFSSTGEFIAAWGWGVSNGEEKYEICTANCKAGIPGPGEGELDVPESIAVDDSQNASDPSKDDVYVTSTDPDVIEKFSAEGEYLGRLTETTGGGAFGAFDGIAVDPSGELWIYQENKEIANFTDSLINVFIGTRTDPRGTSENSIGLAVDANDDLFINTRATEIAELNNTGEQLIEGIGGAKARAVAINPAIANTVYVDDNGLIEVYSLEPNPSPPTLIEDFGSEHEGRGVAVNSTTNNVYVTNAGMNTVEVFKSVILPTGTSTAATSVTETSASLNGLASSNGVDVTVCEFSYGEVQKGGTNIAEYKTPCASLPEEGTNVPVRANVKGLHPHAEYRFELILGNINGNIFANEEIIKTPGAPIVSDEAVAKVGIDGGELTAIVNPEGIPHERLPFEYHFEYGPISVTENVTPSRRAPAPEAPVAVGYLLAGLQADTEYHYRIVVTDTDGTVTGTEQSFRTYPIAVSELADGRVYEMVTPAINENVDVYVPSLIVTSGGNGVGTKRPFEAAASGNAIAYAAEPTANGLGSSGAENGAEYIASRSGGQWEQKQNIDPNFSVSYQAFSSELSVGIFDACEAGSPPSGTYDTLYLYNASGNDFQGLSVTNPNHLRSLEEFGSFGVSMGGESTCSNEHHGPVAYAGASADFAHIIFEANEALTTEAVDGGSTSNNLYDLTDGSLHLVNILPGGVQGTSGGATFGAPREGSEAANGPDFSGAISTDGSRIFWTDLNTERIYLRQNDTATIPVSEGPARFWSATPNGRYALYTEDEKLVRFADEGGPSGSPEREIIASSGVQGILGVGGEAGEYIYFVTKSSPNEYELYVSEPDSEVRNGRKTVFIATLSAEDGRNVADYASGRFGDWQPGLGHRTAEVTPDGRSLVFMSLRSLTGYPTGGRSEVFVYNVAADGGSGGLICASCNPTGEPPSNEGRSAAILPVSYSNTYQPRWISETGSRVFFDSFESLSSLDTNGEPDVYEWEREGAGNCDQSKGCIYLLSGGTSTTASWLLDASANGNDVFIATRARLAPGDHDDNYNVYDVRADAPAEISPLACSGAGCQGIPPAPPIFATPASVTFNGVGNLPSQRKPAPTKGQKLARALKKCRLDRAKRKRIACETQARRHYGAKARVSDGKSDSERRRKGYR